MQGLSRHHDFGLADRYGGQIELGALIGLVPRVPTADWSKPLSGRDTQLTEIP